MSQQTIKHLAQNLTPWKSMDSLPKFILKWLVLAVLFVGINAFWMPWRNDYVTATHDSMFIIESFLWFVLSLTSAFGLYESSFPQNDVKSYVSISGIIFLILLAFAFKGSSLSLQEQWHDEMSNWRGGCGIIISAFAILITPFYLFWAKRGAPKNSGMTGLFAALTSASLGCFLMMLICEQYHLAHLLIWHFTPLLVTCLMGYQITKKLLRW